KRSVTTRHSSPSQGVQTSVTSAFSSRFAQALQAMDRGDFAAAAQTFEAFYTASPHDERAEDAAYLRIVALHRANRDTEAESAALLYLARYPHALRRWEAA